MVPLHCVLDLFSLSKLNPLLHLSALINMMENTYLYCELLS